MANILFLCTHNSARSVLGEAMLNYLAAKHRQDLRAFSAGSHATGTVHPLALQVLAPLGLNLAEFRSKSWDEFRDAHAPPMRLVITVCDAAAAEICPYWPGEPVKAHWGYPDPSKVEGPEAVRLAAFELTRQALAYRLRQLVDLPLATMSDASLRAALAVIAAS